MNALPGMMTDKEAKKWFRQVASQEPDTYYATGVLREQGFLRQQCTHCQKYFWATQLRPTCDDPVCSGGFRFLGKKFTEETLNYAGVWKKFAEMFTTLGYTPIARYPVVARWRDDTDFVQASIYDFQPYVVSGEVSPPANPLVVPQFCLRFNDVDNVGITGSHFTGFVMIGQHSFQPPETWDQARYFRDIHHWLTAGLGLSNDDIVFHEDAWAGGGNFGPCMEFFSNGLELGNQVYMMFEQTPRGPRELKLKVLDMGMGHERNAWFSQAKATSYEATFPAVMEKLRERTGLVSDEDIWKRFIPYAGYLNADETESLAAAWSMIAGSMGIEVEALKQEILPTAALYSVAEHSRSLLVALADGALPSNVGGMYNLRIILRRALGFIDQYGWTIDIAEVCEWHAEELQPLFPELKQKLESVRKIIAVEKEKYLATREKTAQIVAKTLEKKKELTTEDLITLYDAHGISPDLLRMEAEKQGQKIAVPDNFYALVAERHVAPAAQELQITATERAVKLPLEGVAHTKILYYENWQNTKCRAKVLAVIGRNVVIDQTVFYPVSGGQMNDIGFMDGFKIVDAFKQGPYIVHVLDTDPFFKPGQEVTVVVDAARRKQLAQHHTATHIINAAARKVLGEHVNQASAKKDVDKAYLDVTHYQLINDVELRAIEKEANNIVAAKIPTTLQLIPRTEAEQRYGMRIYQGGAVPGQILRIVEIPGVDVEACGGTHLNNTAEAEQIRLLKSSKVKDGVVRVFFMAGDAARKMAEDERIMADSWAGILRIDASRVPARATELFEKWKSARKLFNKEEPIPPAMFVLESTAKSAGQPRDIIAATASAVGTQPEHVGKTLQRFMVELDGFKKGKKKEQGK